MLPASPGQMMNITPDGAMSGTSRGGFNDHDSGVLLGLSAVMFDAGVLNAATQTLMWVVIFFFASAGASAAYLTVSETWPIEIRADTTT
jgi:hypothetical protein